MSIHHYSAGSASPQGTRRLGSILARTLLPGDWVLLVGDLGAGKTVLASGIGLGLGVPDHFHSPSFTICHLHQGTLPVEHYDLYRVGWNEWQETGLGEPFPGGIRIVEWSPPELWEEPESLLIEIAVQDMRHRTFRLRSPRPLRLPPTWKEVLP
jgi:tRNA threonylcarbamoyladenosine biosynthesis protein TsaE